MKVNFENIYEHIGYLFFALASKDGELPTDRLNKLTELIENIWRPITIGDPILNMNLVNCIHTGVKYAIQNEMSAEHAMTSFIDYYRIHSLPFSKALKEKILASSIQIIKEFPAGRNGLRVQSEIEKLFNSELAPT